MIQRIVMAAVIGVLVWVVCLILGTVMIEVHVPILSTVGAFVVRFAMLFGVLAAVYHFLGGRFPPC